jgi:hypothetical protein
LVHGIDVAVARTVCRCGAERGDSYQTVPGGSVKLRSGVPAVVSHRGVADCVRSLRGLGTVTVKLQRCGGSVRVLTMPRFPILLM